MHAWMLSGRRKFASSGVTQPRLQTLQVLRRAGTPQMVCLLSPSILNSRWWFIHIFGREESQSILRHPSRGGEFDASISGLCLGDFLSNHTMPVAPVHFFLQLNIR